eukprot:5519646-Pyramimonas_sp.AAC.1
MYDVKPAYTVYRLTETDFTPKYKIPCFLGPSCTGYTLLYIPCSSHPLRTAAGLTRSQGKQHARIQFHIKFNPKSRLLPTAERGPRCHPLTSAGVAMLCRKRSRSYWLWDRPTPAR